MRREAAVLALVVLLSVGSFASVVAAQETQRTSSYGGQPNLEVYSPSPTVTPGERAEFRIQIANNGEVTTGSPQTRAAVTTARNVRIEVDGDDTPIAVQSGEAAVGSVTENRPRDTTVALEVPSNIEPGTYELDATLEYSYTDRVIPSLFQTSERTETVTRSVKVVVEDEPRFTVGIVETTAQVGASGTAVLEVENVGTEPAREISLAADSPSPQMTFNSAPTALAAVDELEPGETATVEYGIEFAPGADVRSYPVDATVTYEDRNGISGIDEQLRTNVTPASEQTFTVDRAESTLRVGEKGDLRGTIRNTGPVTARSVEIQPNVQSPNYTPLVTSVAVGDLESGGEASFRIPIETSSEAESVRKEFDLVVQYRNADNEQRVYREVNAMANVAERRDEFEIAVNERQIAAGNSRLVAVEVTNNLDEPVTDAEAKLFASDPFDSDDDEGYVESLGAGESTTITFEISADSGAAAKTYPVSFDFRYDDADGRSQVSDTYRIAMTVTEPEGGGLPWQMVGAGGVLTLVALVGGTVYSRRGR